jgi:hypothetical protein
MLGESNKGQAHGPTSLLSKLRDSGKHMADLRADAVSREPLNVRNAIKAMCAWTQMPMARSSRTMYTLY